MKLLISDANKVTNIGQGDSSYEVDEADYASVGFYTTIPRNRKGQTKSKVSMHQITT